MDRLSDMPTTVLHEILSRLPDKDVARTSALSQTWYDIWSTFPMLNFDDFSRGIVLNSDNPDMIQEYKAKLDNFFTSVHTALLRFHDRRLVIKQLHLCLQSFNPNSMSSRMDNLIKISADTGVEVLKLSVQLDRHFMGLDPLRTWYRLPLSLLKAKSLTKLELEGAIRVDQTFLNNEIKFPILQMLSLNAYFGKEEALSNLISGCPMVEHLTMTSFGGLDVVRIRGLPKLKVARFTLPEEVYLDKGVEVDLDTPSVECLEFGSHHKNHKINMDKCRNLKELIIGYMDEFNALVNTRWLDDLFRKFLLLERLDFKDCIMSEKTKISSTHLKILNINACISTHLKEAEIDAPNLHSFRYFGFVGEMPVISFTSSSNHLEDVNLELNIGHVVDFKGLRSIIQGIPRSVLASVTLRIYGKHLVVDELQDIPVYAPRVKQLTLSANLAFLDREECLTLVINLFWSMRPAVVSLKQCTKNFIKVLCKKLMCKAKNCWCQDLKGIKFASSSKRFDNVTDCQTLVDSWPNDIFTLSSDDEISFMLEWDSSE